MTYPTGSRLAVLLLAGTVAAGCEGSPMETEAPQAVAAVRVSSADYRYTVIDVPGAVVTQAFRMNARGDLVGNFQNSTGVHGFLKRGNSYQTIDFPGAAATRARGINERGDIVGMYALGGRAHGFVLRHGEFTTLDVPGAWQTVLWDINANGVISGEYQAVAGGAWHAFVWRGGEFELIAIPGATMSAGFGVNLRGEVVGHYRLPDASQPGGVSKMYGFLWRDGEVTQLDYPVPNLMSCAQGIGDHGAAVGHYWEISSDIVYGYVWQDGAFAATLRVPGAWDTYPTSITPSGVVAGYHLDASFAVHGFIAEPLNRVGK